MSQARSLLGYLDRHPMARGCARLITATPKITDKQFCNLFFPNSTAVRRGSFDMVTIDDLVFPPQLKAPWEIGKQESTA